MYGPYHPGFTLVCLLGSTAARDTTEKRHSIGLRSLCCCARMPVRSAASASACVPLMHRAVLSRYTGYVAGARPTPRGFPASVSHLHAGRPCAVPGPEHRPGRPPFGEEPRLPGEEAYLPEDQEPAPWQRYAQLIAGMVGAGTLVYFVLFADYGDGEHCFRPVRTSPQIGDHD